MHLDKVICIIIQHIFIDFRNHAFFTFINAFLFSVKMQVTKMV